MRYVYIRITTNDSSGTPLTFHYTNDVVRRKPTDPSTVGSDVEWEPRLANIPEVSQSIDSFVVPQINVTSTSVRLINNDNALIDFVKEDYAWLNSEAKIWMEAPNGQVILVFTGVVNTPRMSNDYINMSIKSNLQRLTAAAYFGDSKADCIIDSTTYPSAPTTSLGLSIPLVIGPHAKIGYRRDTPYYYSIGGQQFETFGMNTDQTSGNHGSYVDTTNLVYGRVPVLPIASTLNIAVTQITGSAVNATDVRALAVPDASQFTLGDAITLRFAGPVNREGVVFYIDARKDLLHVINRHYFNRTPATFVPWPAGAIDLVVSRDLALISAHNVNSTDAFYGTTGNGGINTIITYGNCSSFATSGSNYLLKGADNDKFGSYSDYVFGCHGTDFSHSDTIDRLFLNTGLTVDKVNISEVSSVKTLASYPEIPEEPIPSILKVLSELTTGLAVLVNVKANGDILYKLMKNSLTTTETFDDINIIEDSFSINKEYRDMAHVLQLNNSIAENLQMPASAIGEVVNSDVQTIYNIDKLASIKHPHQDVSTFSSRVQAMTKAPITTYSFKVESSYLDIEIGDEVRLNTEKYGVDQNCYVVGFKKSLKEVELTLLKPFSF